MTRLIDRVFLSPRFERELKHLPRYIHVLAKKKDKLFRQNAFHPSLETHKLGGEFKEHWAYSVNREYRVLFYFTDDHSVLYVNIGTHEIYK